ncbi:hypothetical protein MPH47_09700 [Psychrobacillus psychrodurans]|uniref:hypothetical protein n=1 Tax=Psychrobacillus psychrodurans TaxID=126157 RepID=UPI001F4D70B7|nr:hypothetical protein [Psychrobacillus psychrodurans]MCK1997490.1 hypothetical protein [Psychrobacillus psychrodurans]
MHLDWGCPNCNEKHISRIEPIEVGDLLSLKCTDCDVTVEFEVKQKKYILSYRQSNAQKTYKNAVAWEQIPDKFQS